MADKDKDGRPLFQRSPSQASRVFGLDGEHLVGGKDVLGTPRPKFLFLVRFVRGTGGNSNPSWQNGLSIAVKKLDRPQITPEIEVKNQYNKKRLIQTGLKYNPVKIEFHDTADTAVMQMWHEYAAYYFGDFRKATDDDWQYDLISPKFRNSGTGLGFTLPNEDPNQHPVSFFSKVECYQFSGGMYTQYDLINPKIAAFNPDEMDYTQDAHHGLIMSLEYEAILFHNDSVPRSMYANDASATVKSLLSDRMFTGNVFEPPNGGYQTAQNRHPAGLPSRPLSKVGGFNVMPYIENALFGKARQALTGAGIGANPLINPRITSVLGSFGVFNFGDGGRSGPLGMNTGNIVQGVLNGNGGAVLAAYGTSALAGVIGSAAKGTANAVSRGIDAARYDAALGEFQNQAAVAYENHGEQIDALNKMYAPDNAPATSQPGTSSSTIARNDSGDEPGMGDYDWVA